MSKQVKVANSNTRRIPNKQLMNPEWVPPNKQNYKLNRNLRGGPPATFRTTRVGTRFDKKIEELNFQLRKYQELSIKEKRTRKYDAEPQMFGLFGDSSNIVREFARANDHLEDENVKELIGNLNGFMSNFNSACERLSDFSQLVEGNLYLILCTVLLVYLAKKRWSPSESDDHVIVTCLIFIMIKYFMFDAEFYQIVVDFLTNACEESSIQMETVPNAGAVSYIETTAQAIVGFVTTHSLVNKAQANIKPSDLSKILGDFGKSCKGLSDYLKWGVESIESIINWIRLRVGYDEPVTLGLSASDERVSHVMSTVSKIKKLYLNNDYLSDSEAYSMCTHLEAQITQLRNQFRTPDSQDFSRSLLILSGEIFKMQCSIVKRRPAFRGTRAEPACGYLYGEPGVGKSEILKYLSTLLHNNKYSSDPRYETAGASCYVMRKSKYMDGFVDHKVITFDDVFQMVDSPGMEETEALKIINLVNSVPCQAHMAEVTSKGNIYCEPDFVLLSSNVKIPRVSSIESREALVRRFHLKFMVVPKEQYCTSESLATGDLHKRRLDRTKLPVGPDGTTLLDPSIHHYYPYNDDGELCGSPVEFSTVYHQLLQAEEVRKSWHKSSVSNMEEYCKNDEHKKDSRCLSDNFNSFYSKMKGEDGTTESERIKYLMENTNVYDEFDTFHKMSPSDILVHVKFKTAQKSPEISSLDLVCDRMTESFNSLKVRIRDLFYSHLTPFFSSAVKFFSENSTYIALFCSFVGIFVTIPFVSKFLHSVIPASPESTPLKERKRHVDPKSLLNKTKHLGLSTVPESVNSAMVQFLDSRMKNLMVFSVKSYISENDHNYGCALGLKDRLMLIPWHFVTRIASGVEEDPSRLRTQITLKSSNRSNVVFDCEYLLSNVIASDEQKDADICLLDCPHSSQPSGFFYE